MAKQDLELKRYCPGEEQIRISDAVCLGRRRANYFKCPGCQFNDDERGTASFEAGVVGKRAAVSPALERTEVDERMIEKVFKAYDVRATYPDMLNEEIAWRIGNATAQFLRTSLSGYDRSDSEMNKVVIGRDMRTHSPSLQAAFIEGAAATGTQIIDIGMIDTSQIYFAVNHLKCCGGVQTTASHNPENYNGFKICGLKGKPVGADTGLTEIKRIAGAIAQHKVDTAGKVQKIDLAEPYRDYIRRFLREPRRMKIVVDASNGMAGRWFPILFDDLPNVDVIKLNFEHDGTFVHPPNPLVPANLDQLRKSVIENHADFGACFDGDADRCMFVDEGAHIIPCDLLTALLAEEYLRESPGSTIVYDLRSSRAVPETIKRLGGTPKRQRVGHVFMKRAMAEADGVFGGELSGHFYFRDFWYCDSGMLAFVAVLNVLSRTGKPLSQLLAPHKKYFASGERNFVNDDKEGTMRALGERYADGDIDHLDGVTVQFDDWWFNVRPSNTEPLLRLNLEADNEPLMNAKVEELSALLGEPAKEH